MKKILLGLAAVTTVTAPLATVYVMNPNENPPITPDDSVDQVESDKTSVIEFVKTIFQGYTSNSEFIFPTFKEVQSHPQNQELYSDLNLFGISSAQVFDLEERIKNTDNFEYLGFMFDESPSTLTFNFTNDSIGIPNPTWEEEESINIDLSTIEKELSSLNLGSNTYLKPSAIIDESSLITSSVEEINLGLFNQTLSDYNFFLEQLFVNKEGEGEYTTLNVVVKYKHDVVTFRHIFKITLSNTLESSQEVAMYNFQNIIKPTISDTIWTSTNSREDFNAGETEWNELHNDLGLDQDKLTELDILLSSTEWVFEYATTHDDTSGTVFFEATLSHLDILDEEVIAFNIDY